MFLGNLLHMYQIYIKNSNVQKIVVKILVLDSYYTNYFYTFEYLSTVGS